MDTEYEHSRIEKAKRDLYRTGETPEAPRLPGELSASDISVKNDWEDTTIQHLEAGKEGHPKLLKILIGTALATALFAILFIVYQFFNPFAKPSDKNILIDFEVPVGATPGVATDVLVTVTNQNKVPLQGTTMTLNFPDGTRDALDTTKELREVKNDLGAIAPGAVTQFRTQAIFLGEENTDKEVRARLDFRFEGINSVFTKEVARTMHLLASPLNLTVDVLKEINSGQLVEFAVRIASNAVIPLDNVFVKIQYPVGFTYVDADVKPIFGNTVWKVGRMEQGATFALRVKGILTGEDTAEKVFHTTAGVGSDKTERDIATTYSTVPSSIILKRPFIGVLLSLGEVPASQAIAHFGERINGTINWQNNLPVKVTNAQIEVRLRGVALDRSSITAGNGGFFRSGDDTVFWDERGDPKLGVLEAGEVGVEKFSFFPLPSQVGNKFLTNPTITAEVTVRGNRVSESGVPEEIKTVITENVKITSQAQFAARAVYYSGPFVNSGPIPPKVDQETTYTVILSVVNSANNISGVEVRGVLPAYVKWTGAVSPTKENIIFNRNTNEVVWNAGDIPAGTGVATAPREAAFQVTLTPSLTQVKTTPTLISNIHFKATDAFTNEVLTDEKANITTSLSTDPKAVQGSAVVVQ